MFSSRVYRGIGRKECVCSDFRGVRTLRRGWAAALGRGFVRGLRGRTRDRHQRKRGAVHCVGELSTDCAISVYRKTKQLHPLQGSASKIMANDADHIDEENRQLEEANRRLEEENRQLEDKNRKLERNRQLKEKRRQLQEKWDQLVEQNAELKNNKRKASTALDTVDGHHVKRTKIHDRYMHSAIKTFFSSPHFAVAGASSDPHKYGHKVFDWYLHQQLPVTPINPAGMVVTLGGPKRMLKRAHLAVASPSRLGDPTKTSLSVITPPKVTRTILEDAKKAGIRAVWLQPGSFDKDVLKYARKEWPDATIAGTDIPGSGGEDGWCVLVDGEAGLSIAGKLH